MAISPHQVTSNANSKLCRVEIILNDRSRPSAERMAEITRIGEEFRGAVAGSTADPFRPR
jgi:hypothetical protein